MGLFFMDVNGGGLHMLNKLLLCKNGLSFNESKACSLIFNMFALKLSFSIREVMDNCTTGMIQVMALLIHFYGIRKQGLTVAQL